VRPPRLTTRGVLPVRELGDARRLADMLDAGGWWADARPA
jgi:hypothetical protein